MLRTFQMPLVCMTCAIVTFITVFFKLRDNFNVSSEIKILSDRILILLIKKGFAETLQLISFQNDSFVLYRRNLSRGTRTSKINTFTTILNSPKTLHV